MHFLKLYMSSFWLSDNAGRSLRRRRSFISKSRCSRDLLQRAAGLQRRQRRRLLVRNAEVAAYCVQLASSGPGYVCAETENSEWRREGERVSAIPSSGDSERQTASRRRGHRKTHPHVLGLATSILWPVRQPLQTAAIGLSLPAGQRTQYGRALVLKRQAENRGTAGRRPHGLLGTDVCTSSDAIKLFVYERRA